jgi:TatD DNase family protein
VHPLTDTHCHLNLDLFAPELPEILEKALAAGLSRILIPGINLSNSRTALQLAEQYPFLYAAVGVHPNDANTWNANTLAELQELAQHPKAVAIGEIGLDYYRQYSTHEQQKVILRQQLELSTKLNKPLVLHSRNATVELLMHLDQWLPGVPFSGVFHSYEGTLETAQQIMQKGFFLGVTGPITFHNAKERQQLFSQLPVSALLLETDAPYLTPHPWRGKLNQPAYIPIIAQKLADLHNQSLDQIAMITTHNAHQLFQWGETF